LGRQFRLDLVFLSGNVSQETHMIRTSVRSFFTRTAVACLLLAGAAAPLLAQGTTTATIRGRLVGTDGAPVAGTVTVTNTETGVARRTVAGEDGRYAFFGLAVGGPYTVRALAIGYRPQEKAGYRLSLGDILAVDFTLEATPIQVTEISVTTDVAPVVDPQQPGRVDRIGEQQIQSLPTNGRNFSDFIALSPQVASAVGDGSGGNLSIGGGRRGANNILVDGVGANGTFFGGEARGSDRIPFAYSIEAVREFQVETNAYDVTRGNYTGGLVNAVTRSGTNQFRGSVFGYRRSAAYTKNDFLGREPTDFTSNQFGFTFSGPIIRDRLHFFVAVDRQDRDQPVFGSDVSSTDVAINTGIHPDSLARLLQIMQNVYGLDTAALRGRFLQNQDETSVFAKLSWQLSNRHTLEARYNYTDLTQHNDRISTRDLRTSGGDFLNTGQTFVASLSSAFGNNLFNELRVMRSTEPRPRPGYSRLPEIQVDVTSEFQVGDSLVRTTAQIRGGTDPVLHFNNLEESTWELQDNLTWVRGDHTFKVGTTNSFIQILNFFGFNALGTFRFRSLSDFENRAPDTFTRALPVDTSSALPFEERFPKAVYDVREWALYAQDQWQVTPRLNVMLGLRYDLTDFPDRPAPNPAVTAAFPDIDVSRNPRDEDNIAPRFGFTYDMSGNRTTIVRGGAGLFYGRSPYVLFSNAFLNTGNSQLSLSCSSGSGNVPEPNFSLYEQFPIDSIPLQCAGGGAASAGTPTINAFDPGYETPRSFKANIGVDHALNRNTRIGLDFSYSHIDDNFFVIDRNLVTTPQFFTEGGRPVFTPTTGISSSGFSTRTFSRVNSSFSQVLVATSEAEAENLTFTASAAQRFSRWLSFQASYTYSRTIDNSSYSCCIQSTAIFETPTGGNPNDLRDTRGLADYDRPHTIILSGIVQLPWGVRLSGIYRGYSGLPFTPRVSGDANGDAVSGNDRAYVGTNILYNVNVNSDVDTATQRLQQTAILEGLIDRFACLRAQLNTIARRNSCRNPWINQMDLRLSKRFETVRGQSVELVADFFNFLNFLNSEWGRVWTVAGAGGGENGDLLIIRGFNSTQRRYVHDVNPSFGTPEPSPFRFDQFQAQFGLRYNF
jgi:outer membrane receptor protein involved in Fe transport